VVVVVPRFLVVWLIDHVPGRPRGCLLDLAGNAEPPKNGRCPMIRRLLAQMDMQSRLRLR